MESLKTQSMRGIIWSFLNRCSNQLVMFAVSMILARLLSPEDFGVIALANVTIALVMCFSNLGLGTAIIQKKEVDNLDYCTFFWADTGVRLLFFSIIFLTAPFAAEYYNKFELSMIIRVIALGVPIGILSSVSGLKLTRAMDFKTPSIISVISCTVSGCVAVVMALRGYGLWTIVGQQISCNVTTNILTYFRVPWVPKLLFSRIRFLQFFSFGSKMLVTGIMETFYNNITSIIIGKHFSLSSLGYFNKGQSLPTLLINSVSTPINSVTFPMFSKLQGDKRKSRAALSQTLQTSLFFCMPLMVGLIAVAPQLIILLFGEKWLPAVPFLRIIALSYLLFPLYTLNPNAIVAMGLSDLYLKLEFSRKTVGIVLFFLFISWGLKIFIASRIVASIADVIIFTYPMKKLLDFTLLQQIKEQTKTIIGCAVMFLFVYPLQWLKLPSYLVLTSQVLLGVLLYLGWSWKFNRRLLCENFNLLHTIMRQR